MRFLYLLLLGSLLINIKTYSQIQNFNLKNLETLSIRLGDGQDLLSSKVKQKIITETKLKFKSAGIKIVKSDSSSNGYFFIRIQAIKSRFSEHRILLQIGIFENVKTLRKDNNKTGAITYFDESFFKGKNINELVYDEFMDKLIIKFLDKYLDSN